MAAIGQFESDIIRNTTTRLAIPKNPFFETKTKVSISIGFEVMSKNVENAKTKWLPVYHFESEITGNSTTRLAIPKNAFFETKTKSLSLFVLKL